ncbi:MAG: GPR endopeptidase [Firmicutes bacterium]|nr:GPR endopeptidase [Bacillota bacterium]
MNDYLDLWEKVKHLQAEQNVPENALEEYYNVRTDLAIEATEVMRAQTGREVSGARVDVEESEHAKVTRMSILSAQAARELGKMPGHYSTIESAELRQHNRDIHEEVAEVFAREISRFLGRIPPQANVLIVGLGNWNATPDALGPKVVHQVLITRHLYEMTPPELRGELRPVCAIAPGVLGITGMETGEVIKGVVQQIRPAMVIAIDALASRASERLCATIQISDAGISPGSGIGNKRMGITPETLGIPVLAVGVPTVIHATTIANDAMEILARETAPAPATSVTPQATLATKAASASQATPGHESTAKTPRFANQKMQLEPQQKRQMLEEILTPFLGSMIVTPKEIDVLVDDVSRVIAGGLNAALHPEISLQDIMRYVQ